MSSTRICDKHYNPLCPWEAVFSENSEGWSTMQGSQRVPNDDGRGYHTEDVDMDVCGPCNGYGEMPNVHPVRRVRGNIKGELEKEGADPKLSAEYTKWLEEQAGMSGDLEN
jgi:hypothetical protein